MVRLFKVIIPHCITTSRRGVCTTITEFSCPGVQSCLRMTLWTTVAKTLASQTPAFKLHKVYFKKGNSRFLFYEKSTFPIPWAEAACQQFAPPVNTNMSEGKGSISSLSVHDLCFANFN